MIAFSLNKFAQKLWVLTKLYWAKGPQGLLAITYCSNILKSGYNRHYRYVGVCGAMRGYVGVCHHRLSTNNMAWMSQRVTLTTKGSKLSMTKLNLNWNCLSYNALYVWFWVTGTGRTHFKCMPNARTPPTNKWKKEILYHTIFSCTIRIYGIETEWR